MASTWGHFKWCLFKSVQYICGVAWGQNQDWMHVNCLVYVFLCVFALFELGRQWRFHMGCNSRETFVRTHLNPTHLLKHESTHSHTHTTGWQNRLRLNDRCGALPPKINSFYVILLRVWSLPAAGDGTKSSRMDYLNTSY